MDLEVSVNFLTDVFNILLPEASLLITIAILLIISIFYNVKFYKISKWIAMTGVLVSMGMLLQVQIEPLYSAFSGSFLSDTFIVFFKALLLISTLFVILMSKKLAKHKSHKSFQFYALLLSAVLAGMIIISANDFLTLFISMELMSISLFFLIAYQRGYLSKEASFKYIITNSFATAIFLFGASYLYGITSSINFSQINEFFLKNEPNLLYTIASIFIVCGLMFKLAILPFANWVLDVYEAANTAIVAFISTVPKIAVFGVLARLLVFPLSYSFELSFILVFLSVITALWANILAIRQKNIKRIIACSSSANAAYMLFALALVSVYNLSTVIFYLTTYIFMNIGVFAGIILLENSSLTTKFFELKNLAFQNPLFCFCFSICIVALAGFPITAGFVAKIYLLSAIIRSGFAFLPFLILLIVAIIIAGYYYINIIKHMFYKSEEIIQENFITTTTSPLIILYTCTIITILIGVIPAKLIELCQYISYNL